ncbi:prephenate dehydratase [Corynebacterium sphenisci]|uniref:prephenate dehydratase n=1 Tax=Corynebacterium sphenisci TaxID=191493 RepID=UPI0026DF068F|nr:prephenate dehydratase [Corynebacterium sphenisci]MDO5731151.1 prephenate dehydratase [Corynebacterium sphenisci]
MTTVTFLGPAGTFTEAALRDMAGVAPLAGAGLDPVPVDSPAAALGAVRRGAADYACVAIESSVDGPVTSTFDALTAGPELQIYRETEIDVAFSILVRPGADAAAVRSFAAHPVALPQVRQWLDAHLPGVELHHASSNAAAAHRVAEGAVDACAAPARAGELLGLAELAADVADVRGARTRFVLVGRPGPVPARTGRDRTGVSFTLPNRPGTLLDALTEFAVREVNLSRIESRPTREAMGAYRFHVDIIGHLADAPVRGALAALHRRAEDLRFLGSWPAHAPGPADAAPPDVADSLAWVDALADGGRR